MKLETVVYQVSPSLVYDKVSFEDDWSFVVSAEKREMYDKENVLEIIDDEIWIETEDNAFCVKAYDCLFLVYKQIRCPQKLLFLN